MSKMTVTEDIIRDKLALHLEVLEPGLVLIDTEAYLPNSQGTRSFVDILAKDSCGRYVLIELKRSDAAARQAVHEVLKYAEAMKVNHSVRDPEFRLMIVSTIWNEMLVPFSSLVSLATFEVTGFVLDVDENGMPIQSVMVEPIQGAGDRLFIATHEARLYSSVVSFEKGQRSYQKVCAKKKISNFVLVELEATEEHREIEIRGFLRAMNSMRAGFGEPPLTSTEADRMLPTYTHMIYFAMLQMQAEHCREQIDLLSIGLSEEEREENDAYLADFDEADKLKALHDKLLELRPWPSSDYLEVSYPAKFMKITDDDGWAVKKINRFGTLANNKLLTDSAILHELRGAQGVTNQRYVTEFIGSERITIEAINKEIAKCLIDNPIWARDIPLALKTLSTFSASSRTQLNILSPCNVLLSLYLLHAHEEGIRYQPQYGILTEDEDKSQLVFGTLEATGKSPSMREIVREYYDGDPGRILFALSWGGYESDDARIVRDLGLRYSTYRIKANGDHREFSKLSELGWEPCAPIAFMEPYLEFVARNSEFVSDVCDFFGAHWNGSMFHYASGMENNFRT
jgi:hypothetical protein